MDAEIKLRRLRIVSGTTEVVEQQLNRLLDEYTMTSQSFAVVNNQVIMTCVLIHASVLRMMQLAQPGLTRPN